MLIVFILFWFSFPSKLFKEPCSTVILDSNKVLLGAHIAKDGQWRFPHNNNVPDKFKKAIINFEDKRFNYHNGIDYIAVGRAIISNITERKRVSGASTLSMQVIRLSRKGKSRTIFEKIIEMIMASRMELSYSKNEILALYSSNAPFGGNVVGLDAASWRYFKRKPENLSWAEICMLAVLPNNPSLIHPGKNRSLLLKKRNLLLKKLKNRNIIDNETYLLSVDEEIPQKPNPYPLNNYHLLNRISSNPDITKNKLVTTINKNYQKRINLIIERYNKQFKANGINNLASIVIDVESGDILSYVGNIIDFNNKDDSYHVDVLQAERSTGSILKPFLYCAMLSSGEILPEALVADVPTYYSGYSPKNYNLGYDGAVPAKRALARSLNIPAVRMLKNYGIQKFIHILKKLGLTSIDKSSDYYGLSLILGGCEGKLEEITAAYASMARSLKNYTKNSSKYNPDDYHKANYIYHKNNKKNIDIHDLKENSFLSSSAIYLSFDAMLEVERPSNESNWQSFASEYNIAWKTGTSFGFRDGWAIGLTPDFVVGVWAGNADGEGRPMLTGITTAAPVLFEIFEILPLTGNWFEKPYDDMIESKICKKSGYLASKICDDIDTTLIPKNGQRFEKCPYHHIVHIDKNTGLRVNSDCEEIENFNSVPWFILPPTLEYYYKSKNAFYKELPAIRDDCNTGSDKIMELIYPKKSVAKIYIPINLDGSLGSTVFEVAHRDPDVNLYWHIDDNFVGSTKEYNKLAVSPDTGKHVLTVVDENGVSISHEFKIIKRSRDK